MGVHGLHRWWYRRLDAAGIVAQGTTSGERMHKARHTAGQRVLDATGNLKAVQKLLGHSSIQTTGDIYADWDIEAAHGDDGDVSPTTIAESFPPSVSPKSPHLQAFRGISGDGGNRTHVRDRVKVASTSVAGALISSPARLAGGVAGDQPAEFPRLGAGGPHRVSLLSDPGDPRRRLRGPRPHRPSCLLGGEGVLVRVRTYWFSG